MNICYSLADFQEALELLPKDRKIAFVPTMGALHEGHISLIKTALTHSKYVVVSIFVNPTQFNNPDDLARYPRTVAEDCKKLKAAGATLVFIPSVEDIYPKATNKAEQLDSLVFDLGGLDKTGEGPRRPGHFNGVAQVVTRLFDIVKPAYAIFGEKDFQQLAIIRYITKKLGYPVEIIASPTLRGEDGLALSSRNMLLTPEHHAVAPKIYKTLKGALNAHPASKPTPAELTQWVVETINSEPLLKVEYAEIVNSLTLQIVNSWEEAESIQLCTAVFAGAVRLIDNIKLK
ncbi:MAG: pantoate--beta-alanine ligase [Bacteroidetes bacterium GWF2_40_14]|nr:MAG: pantoate--beta-alanine ligase [Bacteroidetes bacterium GWF2_40_14]